MDFPVRTYGIKKLQRSHMTQQEIITSKTSNDQNPFLEDMIPIRAGNLSEFLRDDRNDWTQEDYVEGLKEALIAKGLSQWAIGMFMYEIKQKWPKVTYEIVAAHLEINQHSLEAYTRTYSAFAQYREDYMPSDEYSYQFLRMVAIASSKFNKNPITELERLEEKGITQNSKAAYKEIHQHELGRSIPTLPKISAKWDEVSGRILLKIKANAEAIELVNWSSFTQQLSQLTGKEFSLSEKKGSIEVEPTQT